MADDDLDSQADEIAALSSIYSDKYRVIDEAARVYAVDVTDCGEKPKWTLTLETHFPNNYPSAAPPQYELSAPWLRGNERQQLCSELDNIYLEHLGENIIFLWVEHLRQYLSTRDKKVEDDEPNLRSPSSELLHDWNFEEDKQDHSLAEQIAACSVIPDTMEDADVQCPEIHHTECLKDRRSVFQAHLAKVTHPKQVELVMESLKQNRKIREATHNIQAYRIMTERNGRPINYHGCYDDGETHAGSRMLHLLQIVDANNVLVVVTRWYGGVHLGPDRFKHINNLTRQILEDHGYIREKEGKKGPKSSKKGKK